MNSTPANSRVTLAGNPNTGKTTLFNRLTGSDLKVGNYPGITVDCEETTLQFDSGATATLIDVPGTYSLSARSREEQIALEAVTGFPPFTEPNLAVVVLDATQLTRNLYLALQVIETGVPVVLALNMSDMLVAGGLAVDAKALSQAVGVPVVRVSALKNEGIEELRREIELTLQDPKRGAPGWRWSPETEALKADVEAVAKTVPEAWRNSNPDRQRALALWALLSLDDPDELDGVSTEMRAAVNERREIAQAAGREIEVEVIGGRYAWIDEHSPEFLSVVKDTGPSRTERVDSFMLHPITGFAFFLLILGTVFQSLFAWADPAIGFIEEVFGAIAEFAGDALPEGIFRDFVTEGLIAGVGSVVVFLPQILLLFFFIGVMEASGYMARVAFLMDRLMSKLGLHGRAFVPMMSGFACAIPAILATRTMERRRDRFLTMMVVPLMTCSARLPVYTLIIGALFPPKEIFGFVPVQGLLMLSMYLFSTLVAFAALAVLSRTMFKGPRIPLLLELPPYRLPHWKSVLHMMWQRSRAFLADAGTVILACTIGLWLLLSFPKGETIIADHEGMRQAAYTEFEEGSARDAEFARIDSLESGAHLRNSYAGRLGQAMEPSIEPLGFDWKLGIGLIGSFAAREVFVSTMGVVYGVGADVDEDSHTLREKIQNTKNADGELVYTPLVGLSLMVFFALACQCMGTLAAVYRETHTWRWPLFLFFYMTALAWLSSFIVYQGGLLLGFE